MPNIIRTHISFFETDLAAITVPEHNENLQNCLESRVKEIGNALLNSSDELSENDFMNLAIRWAALDGEVDRKRVEIQKRTNRAYTLTDLLLEYSKDSTNDKIEIPNGELMHLGPQDWLKGDHINAALTLLKEQNGGRFEFVAPESCRLEDHANYQSNLNAMIEQFGDSAAGIANDFNHQADFIAFPINIGNYHWTMAIADRTTNTVKYYDSMGSRRLSSDLSKRLETIRQAMKSIKSINDSKKWKIKNVTKKTHQQRDSYNCGVYSIMTAERILRGKSVLNPLNIAAYREGVNSDIQTYFRQQGTGLGAILVRNSNYSH
ncbi:MAG: hypothetical protein ACI9S8_001993 [Chlamydiales bacterium]|jgi:hypothetical protein